MTPTLREQIEAALKRYAGFRIKQDDCGPYIKVDPAFTRRVLESWIVMERALGQYADADEDSPHKPQSAIEALRAAREGEK